MSHYLDYYRRTIAAHPHGLKLVLGGTGLGKTSSLAKLLHSSECPPDVKFVYVANRLQLLDEVEDDVKALGRHLRQGSEVDQLRPLVGDSDDLLGLLDLPAFAQLLAAYKQTYAGRPIELPALRATVRRCKGWLQLSDTNVPELLSDQSALVAELMRPLRHLLAHARRLATERPRANQPLSQRQADDLARHPVWGRLFPYYRFRTDPAQRLLLLTVQKGFHGVFNGEKMIRLGAWEPAPAGTRYVFVFDEFDFLENDLLTLLARERDVSDPFGLVRTFYNRIRTDKLVHDAYLREAQWAWVRQEMEDICGRLDELADHGIPFPELNHFITRDKALEDKAIFQTNYSLVSQPVYLREPSARLNSIELTVSRGGPSAFRLLDTVSRAVKDIVRLFKRVQADHEDIYPELLRHCFGSTTYVNEIRRIKQIGARHEWTDTTYGDLLTNGFGLFEIRSNQSQLTDAEEIAVRYLSVNRSPESIVRELARQHLVFGLSATAHITRTLRNFDWRGFINPLPPTEAFAPLHLTEEDTADIARANADKAQVRGNQLYLAHAEPLAEASAFGRQLTAMARGQEDVFGVAGSQARDFRLKRVRHFFGLLDGLALATPGAEADAELPDASVIAPIDAAAPPTHLVFLGSLKQVQALLDNADRDEDNYLRTTPAGTEGDFRFYDVRYRTTGGAEVACHVVLYDARLGRALRRQPELEARYNALFWDGKPVVVLTTYPSAGNGVNLQYYPTPQAATAAQGKRDFTHLYLLDAPFYYFSGTDPEASAEDNYAAIKRDVYGILKLLSAKIISDAQARAHLPFLRHLSRFNKEYLPLPDGLLNQFSVFVQALGRIERVWAPMPAQTLHLDREVYKIFERLVADPALALESAEYQRYASPTMRQLLTTIAERAAAERAALEDELLSLQDANAQARAAIHRLVDDLETFRATGQPADARTRWEQLRRDVLRHQFRADSLQRLLGPSGRPARGVFRTDYVRAGRLLLNPHGEAAPPDARSADFEEWDLNAVYRPLVVHPTTAVTNHFRRRGYELGFLDAGWYLLPYVYQAILAGAIGEEAIQAVLAMGGITASGRAVPDSLYELADLRIESRPIFIDCKNYGVRTLTRFPLPPEDPRYHPRLNEEHFRARMLSKLRRLTAGLAALPDQPPLAEPCRLVVMNLISADDEATVRYYDDDFERVAGWESARIIVLTGALKRAPPAPRDLLTDACQQLLKQLR